MLSKSKKGAIGVSLDTIIELSMTVLVFLMWFGFYLLVSSDTALEQKNAVINQAMMVQLAMNAPYEINLHDYSRNLWFTYKFSENYISVQDRALVTRLRQPESFDFIANGWLEFTGGEFTPRDTSVDDQIKEDALKSGAALAPAYSASFHICKQDEEFRVAEECEI